MTKIANKFILTAFLLTTSIGFSQKKEVDSLIEKISNKDAYIVLLKTMSPRITGEASNKILNLGKKASPELINILDNENKGIIAHFLLCKIWEKTWEEEVCCNISYSRNKEIVTINGLEIQIENNTLSSEMKNLKESKEAWEKLCHA